MREPTQIIADLMAEGITPKVMTLVMELHAAAAAAAAKASRLSAIAEAEARADRKRAQTRARVAKHRAGRNALHALHAEGCNAGGALHGVTEAECNAADPALPAPSPDGRPSPPAPPHPTLNPSPTLDSQTGAGALGDEGDDQAAGLDLGDEPANPDPSAGKRAKADKPRMNDWPEDFREQFWAVYPRKVAKKPAMKELERIFLADKVPFFEIIEGVKLLVRLGIEPEFIKHPDSWLRNERWNDEQTQRLNNRNRSTNPQNRMTLAAESKTHWFETAKAADEQLRRRAHEQRNDDAPPAGPALDHEPRRQPGPSAEPGARQRPDAGRFGAGGGSGDGRRPAFASLPPRIPGW